MPDSHLLSKTVIQNVSAELSNTNLDNLTSTGESHFQTPLVSGDNIKTINSNSLLGSGDLVITSVPVGTVLVFAGSTAPTGYLLCDGSAVSRTTYSSLFAVIGTTYGVGDNSSTFNLPNYSDERTIVKTYSSGTNWYRIWSDGWVEQGGVAAAGGSVTVTFLKAFKNTNYTVCATALGSKGDIYAQCINKRSATQMVIVNSGGVTGLQKSWQACGYSSNSVKINNIHIIKY